MVTLEFEPDEIALLRICIAETARILNRAKSTANRSPGYVSAIDRDLKDLETLKARLD